MILINNVSSDTIELKIKEKYKPIIKYSYKFIDLSNGGVSYVDRGFNSDSYTCEVTTYGTQTYIDNIILFLQTIRDDGFDMSLSEFNPGEHIFGENIDYTSPINVGLINIDKVNHETYKGVSLKLTFSVENTSTLQFIGTGQFPILQCLQSKYIADTSWNYTVNKSYHQNHYMTDHIYDIGKYESTYILSKSNTKELREFYRQQRGEVFQVDNNIIKGIDKIFGIRGLNLPVHVRIYDMKETFRDVNTFNVKLTLIEDKT